MLRLIDGNLHLVISARMKAENSNRKKDPARDPSTFRQFPKRRNVQSRGDGATGADFFILLRPGSSLELTNRAPSCLLSTHVATTQNPMFIIVTLARPLCLFFYGRFAIIVFSMSAVIASTVSPARSSSRLLF